jgi:hypothetical protein
MNAHTRAVGPGPLSLALRVDAVCYRFERAWREGRRPRVEDFLDELSGADLGPLLRELVLLEADYRRGAQETPEPNEYLTRFPALDAGWLAAALTPPDPAVPRDAAEGTPAVGGARYRVLRRHARGGLGAIFVALDRELHREVALKEILPEQAADPHSRRRFLVEAEVTGNLEHPGVVPVWAWVSRSAPRGCSSGPSTGNGQSDARVRFLTHGDRLKDSIPLEPMPPIL